MPSVVIGNTLLESVDSLKLLGVIIQADLKWDKQVSHMTSLAAKCLYILCILKKFHAPTHDLLTIYLMYIRPLLEYASPSWSSALTVQQSDQIERIQRRACRIILGYNNYSEYSRALEFLNIPSLKQRRNQLLEKFARTLVLSRHRSLLPPLCSSLPNFRPLRSNRGLFNPTCRTSRYEKSAVPQMVKIINALNLF